MKVERVGRSPGTAAAVRVSPSQGRAAREGVDVTGVRDKEGEL